MVLTFNWSQPGVELCGTEPITPTRVIVAPANDVAPETAPPPAAALSPNQQGLKDLVTAMVLDNIPHHYVNEKQWGQQKAIFSGLKVEREGLKLETRRRTKMVNDGSWKRYEVDLIDPQNTFHLRITDHRETDEGLRFTLDCSAKVHVFGRLSQWERGVQLISLSADADAVIRLRTDCLLKLELDASRFPPDVLLRPKVIEARLELEEFRLHRLSDLHGPLAKHLGEGLHEILDDKLTDQNDRLAAKMNRQIEKQQDKLRLSLQDLVTSKWGDLRKFVTGSAEAKSP